MKYAAASEFMERRFSKMAKGGVNIETIGAWAINLDSLAFTYKFLFCLDLVMIRYSLK